MPGPASSGPIFVDASGRRLRRIKLLGLAALTLVAGYVVLLVVALAGGPNVGAPYLPRLGGPAAIEVPASAPKPKPVPVRPAGEAAPGSAGAPVPAVQAPGPAAEAPPSSAPAPAPSAPVATGPAPELPGSAGTPRGTDAVDPGMSGTAPGQATKPTQPARP
ncbi:hypothetical protein ACIQC0_07130 [Pseudarthrobacter sp. NPDC092419]|uniref:hypothetical protein n=1 Tax=Pseudarthrobacter sp. NPDC092419 TaxID=3364414 RepID=UPI003816212F